MSEGVLVWRKFSDNLDIVAMSDYSPVTGKIMPLKYIHVNAVRTEEGGVFVKCSCSMCQTIESVAIRRSHLELGEDVVLDPKFTCMHCRFFVEF